MRAAALSLLLALLAACGEPAEEPRAPAAGPADRAGALDEAEEAERPPAVDGAGVERVDGVWLFPVDTSFAEQLEPAVAGPLAAELEAARLADDVLFAQLGPQNVRVVRTLETVLGHGDALSAASRGKLSRYLAALAVHHGTVPRSAGARTNAAGLLRPEFIPGELAAAADLAAQAGAQLDVPKAPGLIAADRVQEIEALLAAIRPAIFGPPARRGAAAADAGAEGEATPAAPPAGPSREVAAAFAAVVRHLESRALARPGAALGDAQLARPAPGTIFLAGFAPAARGGEARALVGVPDGAAQKLMDAAAARAAALDKIVRAQGGGKSVTEALARGRATRAVRDLSATGALGPLHGRGELWRMIDGPVVEIDAGGRGEAWLLTGAAAAFDAAFGARLVEAFAGDPATAARRLEWRAGTRVAMLALREAAGRGTDGTETRSKDWVAAHLGAHAPVLAAMRADLAALHLAFDPLAWEIGVVGGEEHARAVYEDYVGWAFESYGFGAPPPELAAVAEARRVITRNLVAAGAVAVASGGEGAAFSWSIADPGAARAEVARLLAEVRRIRFVGDAAAAAALSDTMRGSEAHWQRGVEARYRALDRPRAVGFSYPHLRSVRGAGGAVERLAVDAAKGCADARLAAGRTAAKPP